MKRLSIFLIAIALITNCGNSSNPAPSDVKVQSIKMLSENSARPNWDLSGSNRIAFDRKNADGYYDVYVINADGSGLISVTDGKSGVWQRHNGNPCWHPSGRFIVFQSEHPEHLSAGKDKFSSEPGVGVYNELWVTNPTGDRFWQLTFHEVKMNLLDNKKAVGVLNPRFSQDGSRLIWTERYDKGGRWGKWRIMMADFIIDEARGPHLGSQRIVLTASDYGGSYVTCMGMTPDGTRLSLAGNLSGQDEFGMDLYLYDLGSMTLKDLTNDPKEWTEGAAITPDGKKILYMSNKGYPLDPANEHWYWQKIKREYWIMNLDGSEKRQVTHFNTPGYSEYRTYPTIVAACSWSPDGKRLAATIGEDIGTEEKANFILKVVLIEFNRPL